MSIPEGPYQERSTTVVTSQQPVTAEPVVAAPVTTGAVRTTTAQRFTPDAVVAGLVGLAALIGGLVVLVRAGFDSPLSQPVVGLLGFDHTASLGLIEAGIGIFLLVGAAAASRGAEVFGGLAMVVGGAIGVIETDSFREELALDRDWAWVILIAGAIVAVTALVLPRMARSSTVVRPEV